MMEEIWKDIKGYEGLYQVSNMGRVRSLDRDIVTTYRGTVHTRHYKGKIIKPKYATAGYQAVVLANSGVHIRADIHRIVALHFCDGYKDGLVVNHKNEIKDDNRAENLEFVTYSYNSTYGEQFKHRYDKRSKRVLKCDKDGTVICEYKSLNDAARQNGTAATVISRWCKSIYKPQNEFIWRFAE